MGNSSSKSPKNKLKVRVRIRNFAIQGLPQKPPEWSQRVDERMWNEFVSCVRIAATLEDAEQRKTEYKKWYCNFWLGMALFMIGLFAAIGMGVGGGVSGTTVVWIFAIIFGVFGVVGGLCLFIISATKYGEINKQYISDVKASISSQLMRINNKYANIIRFTVGGTGNNIFKNKEDADTTVNISITIELLAQTVQYIPEQNIMPQNSMIQQQATMQNQGQIIMVQMPDGRMVPAQIQGQQQPVQQQIIYQQPLQQQVVVVPQPTGNGYQHVQTVVPQTYYERGGGQIEPQIMPAPSVPEEAQIEPGPPAYNPGANGNIEEQNYAEGGEGQGNQPTNGGYYH